MDLHWVWRALLWGCGLAGLVWATWDKVLPEIRDETARAAQPGLYEGSHHNGGGGDSSGS
ncbi:hypothetical protein AAFO92_22240 [Roseovarius sp. CAU 1744]|uniref:hypothetical protein n=1 Tax=Roseovarius sp. CAU 1744 TaxID=3140368 RepID=UPI00325AB93C